ncbi:MAG TPA: hypothetical protein VK747_22295 [Blastocatellia bacterium]|nr:hypothetical protein [Blastocatellia bacterium]
MNRTLLSMLMVLILASFGIAQDAGQAGFVISLKNGSSIRGRTLTRDESSGTLRLAMTETGSGEAKSYAMISPDDAVDIRSTSTETDSIRIRLKGGSELKCKEFVLQGDAVAVKLGSASRVEVKWSDIESISFTQ